MSSSSGFSPSRAALPLLTLLLLATPALADRPGERGPHGHGHERPQYDERDRGDYRGDYRGPEARGDRAGVVIVFDDRSRGMVDDYYAQRARKGGGCPPGLAKKHNGCQPPGQARRWQRGQPLPHDLRPLALPRDLQRRLPPPPRGYRYVRVAGDILMIAIGTQMVVDAIEDIVR